MRTTRSRFLLLAACCALGATSPFAAQAQAYPTRPLTFVVPNSAGTQQDLVARVMAPEMAKALGQPVVIENRPGAGQMIGYEHVAKRAPADGYTFCVVSATTLSSLTLITKEVRFDPLKDLPPVIGLGEIRSVFGTSSKMPWKTFGELVTEARNNPGKLNFGASAASVRFPQEAFLRALGLDVTYVPYSGGGPYLLAVASGEIQMGFVGQADVVTFADKFRPLAVTGTERREPFMDVPTFSELGLPQIRGLSYSLNMRAGTPREIVDRIHAAASFALKQPSVRELFARIPLDVVEESPEVAQKRLLDQAAMFADVARRAGIQPQ